MNEVFDITFSVILKSSGLGHDKIKYEKYQMFAERKEDAYNQLNNNLLEEMKYGWFMVGLHVNEE